MGKVTDIVKQYNSAALNDVNARINHMMEQNGADNDTAEKRKAWLLENRDQIMADLQTDPLEVTFKYPAEQVDLFCFRLNRSYRPLDEEEQKKRAELGRQMREKYTRYAAGKTIILNLSGSNDYDISRAHQAMLDVNFEDEDFYQKNTERARILEKGTIEERRNEISSYLDKLNRVDLTGLDLTDDQYFVDNFEKLAPIIIAGAEIGAILKEAAELGLDYSGEEHRAFVEKMDMLMDISYIAATKVDVISHPVYTQVRFEGLNENFINYGIFNREGEMVDVAGFFEELSSPNNKSFNDVMSRYAYLSEMRANNPLLDTSLSPDERMKKHRECYESKEASKITAIIPEVIFMDGELVPAGYNEFASEEELKDIEDRENDELLNAVREEYREDMLFDETDREDKSQEGERIEGLRKAMLENVALIREIIPDFRFDESRMDRYFSPERMALHRRAVDYTKFVNQYGSEKPDVVLPEAYVRNMYTFLDPEIKTGIVQKNEEIVRAFADPSPEGDAVRRQAFVDSLNEFQRLDMGILDSDMDFNGKMNYVMDNIAVLERGMEFERTTNYKQYSLGIAFSEEHEKNIKIIKGNAVDIGGRGGNYRRIMESDLFFTFPFEELSFEQSAVLFSELPRVMKKKGFENEMCQKYSSFVNTWLGANKPLENEAYESYEYSLEDIRDTRHSLKDIRTGLTELYANLLEVSTREERKGNTGFAGIMDAMRDALGELKRAEGPVSVSQAICLKYAIERLCKETNGFGSRLEIGKLSDFEAIRMDYVEKVYNLVNNQAGDSALFKTIIDAHQRENGRVEGQDFYSQYDRFEKAMKNGEVDFSEISRMSVELGMTNDEFVKEAVNGNVKWKMNSQEISSFLKKREKNAKEKRYKDVKEMYDLSDRDMMLFGKAEISLEELNEIPFMKRQNSYEQRKKALHEYLDRNRRFIQKDVSDEYRNALAEAELTMEDVRILSLRQGIDVETYIQRMMGIEEVMPDLGEGVIAPEKPNDTIEKQIDDAIRENNEALRRTAKNHLESLLAENMIEMKEHSFNYGERDNMERCVARHAILKSIQTRIGLKPGEVLTDDSEKGEQLRKMCNDLDRYTEEIMENDTFRYFIKKISGTDLVNMSRGTSFKPLDDCCGILNRLIKENSIHTDFVTAMDRMVVYSESCQRREEYFPKRIDYKGNFINVPKNPFGLTLNRTAINTLAIGNLLRRGFEMEDILDPYKLREVKKQVGDESYEQVQQNTPENKKAIFDAYMAVLEKGVKYADRKLAQLNSLNPADIVKSNNLCMLEIGYILKDASQEIGRITDNPLLSEKELQSFDELSGASDCLNAFYLNIEKCFKHLSDMGMKTPGNSLSDNMSFILCDLYANKEFIKIKQRAEMNGRTISKELTEELKNSPNMQTTTFISLRNAQFDMTEIVNQRWNPERKAEIANDPKLRIQMCEAIFNGEFGKKIFNAQSVNGRVTVNDKYLESFSSAPRKEAQRTL